MTNPDRTLWVALHTYGDGGWRKDGEEIDKDPKYGGGYKRKRLLIGQPSVAFWSGGKEYWHIITGYTIWLDEAADDCQIEPFCSLDSPVYTWRSNYKPSLLDLTSWFSDEADPLRGNGRRNDFTLRIRNFRNPFAIFDKLCHEREAPR